MRSAEEARAAAEAAAGDGRAAASDVAAENRVLISTLRAMQEDCRLCKVAHMVSHSAHKAFGNTPDTIISYHCNNHSNTFGSSSESVHHTLACAATQGSEAGMHDSVHGLQHNCIDPA